MANIVAQAGGNRLKVISPLNVHVIQIPVGSVGNSIQFFSRNPNVVYAEPDFYRILVIPDEGENPPPAGTDNQWFNEQWALNNTAQPLTDPSTGLQTLVGSADADIDAPEGWDISTGSTEVKIAILDTGVDCRTIDRPGGSLEFIKPSKCVEEVNFVSAQTSTLDDVAAHGSHVAGIAAASTNNDIGIAGVGWNSSIGSLKACFEYYYDQFPPIGMRMIVGVCPVSSSAAAITYAADNGYHVINMSYASDEIDENNEPIGLGGWTQTESDAVEYAWGKGVVLVAAAGNSSSSVESYPAAYEPVIAVGATDRHDDRASFSSFGSSWVSLLAPGDTIISTVPNELCVFYADLLGEFFDPDGDACLDWYSGTSMASPHVAGAAALVWAHQFSVMLDDPASCEAAPGVMCNQVVRQKLEAGADATGALGQNMLAWSQHGRLNLVGALSDNTYPPVVTINSPIDGDVYPEGTSISFQGSANDNEDGDLTSSITWSSNLDGLIGSGGSFTSSTLSLGLHVVTASATDTDSATGSEQVSFTIEAAGGMPPSAPTSVLVTDLANGSAQVTWIDGSNNEEGFDILRESPHKRRPDVWVGSTLVGSVDANITTYTDASGAGTYRYCVQSSNTYGLSEWVCSNVVTISDAGNGGGGGDTSFCDSHPTHKKCQ